MTKKSAKKQLILYSKRNGKTDNNTTSVSFKTLTEDLNFSENLDAMDYETVFVNHQRWLTKS